MTEQELNEKEAKNIDRVISILKSILAFYESKATPRRPLKSIRWALVVAIALCGKQIAKKPLPIITDDNEFICVICPTCQRTAVEVDDLYCRKCGQKLVFDWGNEDD